MTAGTVTVMCSETVWWRCHRRLLADVAVVAHDIPVHHLMHNGQVRPHVPAAGAPLRRDDVVWDGPREIGPAPNG